MAEIPIGMWDSPELQKNEIGWSDAVLPEKTLKVYFDSFVVPNGLQLDAAFEAVERAMESWNAGNIGIRFERVVHSFDEHHVKVAWQDHDPEGYLNELRYAHADFPPGNSLFPPPPIPMCFSNRHDWGVDGSGHLYDVETVALHEFGHAIGLFHRGRGSIMFKHVLKGEVVRSIDSETLTEARSLYS